MGSVICYVIRLVYSYTKDTIVYLADLNIALAEWQAFEFYFVQDLFKKIIVYYTAKVYIL